MSDRPLAGLSRECIDWLEQTLTKCPFVTWDDDADEDYGVVLNAADYGDPQSRERLFIMASRSKLPTAPPRTHSDDPDDDLPPRRPAADVIDWSDLGLSLWTRDLERPRVTPLAADTMARIAEGIRRHCSDRLAPFADAVEAIHSGRLEELRERIVPVKYGPQVAAVLDEPFLVHVPGRVAGSAWSYSLGQHGNSVARDVDDRPASTVARSGNLQLCSPAAFCLRQQSGGVPVPADDPLSTVSSRGAIGVTTVESRTLVQPRNGQNGGLYSNVAYDAAERPLHTVIAGDSRQGHVLTPSLVRYSHGGASLSIDEPMPTVATEKGGTFALSQPYLCPLYQSRVDQEPRTRSVGRPLMTVPASKAPAGVATPFLVQYNGNSDVTAVDEPIPTVPTKGRFALCLPEAWPWGLDVRYRMLQPDELKQAQGFPADYEITGSAKKTRTAQIGNAVPVNLARALARHLLADETPSLSTFGGGLSSRADVQVPDYKEVSSDD